MRTRNVSRILAAALTAFALAPFAGASSAEAQSPNANARALGMGGNFAGVARGYSAVAWNPAALGLPDNPGFTFTITPVSALAGLRPIGLSHLDAFAGDTVPRGERELWLAEIEQAGGETGSGGASVTYLALSAGPVALQLSSSAHAAANLSPGAAELVLFGNAGRTGEPCTCSLEGFSLSGHAISTAALSFGFPVNSSTASYAALGATVSYSVGHAMLRGLDLGSELTADPSLSLRFPVVMTDTAADLSNTGSGVGLDLAFAMQEDDLTLALGVQNLVQTFAWDETMLSFVPGTAVFDRESSEADFDPRPFDEAPEVLRTYVAEHRWKPRLVGGVAVAYSERLTLAGDVRVRLGDSTLDPEPGLHIGGGAELALPILSLQAGGAVVSDGYQIGGGFGLDLGPLNLGASVLRRDVGGGTGVVAMLTLMSSGR